MALIDWTQFHELGLPRIGQLSFIIEDMEAKLPGYASLYDISTWYRTFIVQNSVQYGEVAYEAEWDFVYGYSGKMQVELIDLRGDANNIFARFLDEHGPGLHHLGFYLSDLDSTVARAKALGIKVLQTATLRMKGGLKARVAFLDTAPICGLAFELIEVKRGRLTVPSSRLMMEVGVLIGGGEKIRI